MANECVKSQLVRRVDYSRRASVTTVMGLLFCVGRETKKSQNDYFFGEAFRFDVWMRLKDQYKNECGQ